MRGSRLIRDACEDLECYSIPCGKVRNEFEPASARVVGKLSTIDIVIGTYPYGALATSLHGTMPDRP